MSKVHIEGWSDKITLADELSGNCDVPYDFGTDDDVFEATLETFPEAIVQIYSSDTKKPLEQAKTDYLREILGGVVLEGSLEGYSEYTITGFNIERCWLGGHDIQRIIDAYDHKYLHILIDFEPNHKRKEPYEQD